MLRWVLIAYGVLCLIGAFILLAAHLTTALVTYLAINGLVIAGAILFEHSHGYNWLDDGGGAGNCTFTGGAYLVSVLDQGSDHYCTASPNFSDSAYQVQTTIVHGDTGGIIFHSDATKQNGYVFTISQDGKYVLYLFKNSSSSFLLGGSSTAINTGLNQSNTVAVVANGSTINLYVNNQNIDHVSDNTYLQGQIGVSAIDLNNPTEVVFSNSKVWT